jgi:hypothetical protein
MTGCPGPKAYVPLNQYRYIPAFPAAKFAGYKGTEVNLLNFSNYAQNTNIFHYYSPDRSIYYESPLLLSSYLWYTFRDAFNQVGIRVHENVKMAPGITDMHLIMLSMTDRNFDFRVNVTRDGITIMQKIYSVTMPAYENYDVATLEKNAYSMIDKSVVTLLSDPDFLKALKR